MDAQSGCQYEDVRIRHVNGTTLYKAPEVVWSHAKNSGVTPRADMFSLGVVLLDFALQLRHVSWIK